MCLGVCSVTMAELRVVVYGLHIGYSLEEKLAESTGATRLLM
ncbi:hypothetical protein LINGRAHAP2_LOCUS9805 [Linum grandiflorum]